MKSHRGQADFQPNITSVTRGKNQRLAGIKEKVRGAERQRLKYTVASSEYHGLPSNWQQLGKGPWLCLNFGLLASKAVSESIWYFKPYKLWDFVHQPYESHRYSSLGGGDVAEIRVATLNTQRFPNALLVPNTYNPDATLSRLLCLSWSSPPSQSHLFSQAMGHHSLVTGQYSLLDKNKKISPFAWQCSPMNSMSLWEMWSPGDLY